MGLRAVYIVELAARPPRTPEVIKKATLMGFSHFRASLSRCSLLRFVYYRKAAAKVLDSDFFGLGRS